MSCRPVEGAWCMMVIQVAPSLRGILVITCKMLLYNWQHLKESSTSKVALRIHLIYFYTYH